MTLDFGTITTIVGLVIGVYGIVLAIRSKREKLPSWAIRSETLIEGNVASFGKLSVKYDRKNVENVTVSKVLFWNDGKEVIDKNDLETNNPLTIKTVGTTRILDVKVLANNHSAINFQFQIDADRKSVLLQFDYLNHKDGVVIQVVHTGTSSSDICVEGDIKGTSKLRNKLEQPKWILGLIWIQEFVTKYSVFRVIYWLFASIFALYLLLFGIYYSIVPESAIVSSQAPNITLLRFQAYVSIGVLLLLVSLLIRLFQIKSIAPKGLQEFYKDDFQKPD